MTLLMSTPFRRKTGPKYRGRWGRRLFEGMDSVFIYGAVQKLRNLPRGGGPKIT